MIFDELATLFHISARQRNVPPHLDRWAGVGGAFGPWVTSVWLPLLQVSQVLMAMRSDEREAYLERKFPESFQVPSLLHTVNNTHTCAVRSSPVLLPPAGVQAQQSGRGRG